jgi:hypothetical protein
VDIDYGGDDDDDDEADLDGEEGEADFDGEEADFDEGDGKIKIYYRQSKNTR